MRGKSQFSKDEAHEIRNLLAQKCQASRGEQKKLRRRLRALRFFISDFGSRPGGFDVADFDNLTRTGIVTVDRDSPSCWMHRGMNRINSELSFPMVAPLGNGVPGFIGMAYLPRIEDCVAIINRITNRWDLFCSHFDIPEHGTQEFEDELRLEVIEDTYAFISFFFLLIGFHRGICKCIDETMRELSFGSAGLPDFPAEEGNIRIFRTIRNKMVAHTANVEPHKNDTISNRLAYLEWFVGSWGRADDPRNKRLNPFSMRVGNEDSSHAIPPVFSDMIQDAQAYLRRCEACVRSSARVLANRVLVHRPDGFEVVGEHRIKQRNEQEDIQHL